MVNTMSTNQNMTRNTLSGPIINSQCRLRVNQRFTAPKAGYPGPFPVERWSQSPKGKGTFLVSVPRGWNICNYLRFDEQFISQIISNPYFAASNWPMFEFSLRFDPDAPNLDAQGSNSTWSPSVAPWVLAKKPASGSRRMAKTWRRKNPHGGSPLFMLYG